jgi:hypothetical protein
MSKTTKFVIAGITAPQRRLNVKDKTYEQPDTFLVTVVSTLTEAKDFIDNEMVPDSSSMQYLVIEEIKEGTTLLKIQRWYICKEKEIIQLAGAPDQYSKYTSMLSM